MWVYRGKSGKYYLKCNLDQISAIITLMLLHDFRTDTLVENLRESKLFKKVKKDLQNSNGKQKNKSN